MSFEFNLTNTFCISMDSSIERWERMKRRFEYFHLNVTKWKASTIETIQDVFELEYNGRKLRPTEIACAQSHVHIWKYIVNNQLPYAFIMEDDACFDKQWRQKLNTFPINTKWHMILLNALAPSMPLYKWNQCNGQWLAGGYILSLEGANVLLSLFHNKFTITDVMTRRLQSLGLSYTYFPWLIIQEGMDSNNGNNSIYYYNRVVENLLSIHYSVHNYI